MRDSRHRRCGSQPIAAEERGKALDLMKLRGPDASGEWEGENVWLGHRRLAIIDLSPRGHQPMFSPDGATSHP